MCGTIVLRRSGIGGQMIYTTQFDISALMITLVILFYFIYKNTIKSQQNILFLGLIVCALVSNISDLISIYAISYSENVPIWFQYFINEVYLASFSGTAVVYLLYIICLTTQKRMSLLYKIRIFLPYVVLFILVFSSDVTGYIFYLDEQGKYCHGKAFILMYICAFYYMISALIYSIVGLKKIGKAKFNTIIFFTISILLSIAIQMMFEGLLIIQFMISVSVLVLYLSLENPENYMDRILHIFNNKAFIEVFNVYTATKKKFVILGIEIGGIKYINENLGVIAGNTVMREIASFFKSVAGRKNVFHMSGSQFVIMSSDQSIEWDDIIDRISDRFSGVFECSGMEITLAVNMCIFSYPEVVSNMEDAIDLLEYSFKHAKEIGGSRIVHGDKELLAKGKRETQIIYMLGKAIKEDGFCVHYQPIYSVEKGKYTTAEALVRFKDSDIGFVSPEEFIPIAEKNGMIVRIGEIVFEKVCKFYKENNLEEKGIENIHFNLSVVECMQQRLHEKIKNIMDKYQLDSSKISLEITETAAVTSREILINNMNQLIDRGFKFSMDDYGTGFSNTSTLIAYPFDEIKIDKSIVWSAMEDEKAMIAFKHNVAMIKDLDFKIVAEGVETKEQAKMLGELGCDYFQGYYYSKPVGEEEFMSLID